jgi:hypothetical protein
VLVIIDALRRRGVELAQGSERFVGGVMVVRGSVSDWLADDPADQGGKLPPSAERGQPGDTDGASGELSAREGGERRSAGHAQPAAPSSRRRRRNAAQ